MNKYSNNYHTLKNTYILHGNGGNKIISKQNENAIQLSSNKKSFFIKNKIDNITTGNYLITRNGFCNLCNKNTEFSIQNKIIEINHKNNFVEYVFDERFYKDYIDFTQENSICFLKN
jgi:hypothetical protein